MLQQRFHQNNFLFDGWRYYTVYDRENLQVDWDWGLNEFSSGPNLPTPKKGLRHVWLWMMISSRLFNTVLAFVQKQTTLNRNSGFRMTGSYRYRVGPPLINKLVMKPMSYSCWGYVYQLSYRLGAPPCMRMRASRLLLDVIFCLIYWYLQYYVWHCVCSFFLK